jgi:hypothetical protein
MTRLIAFTMAVWLWLWTLPMPAQIEGFHRKVFSGAVGTWSLLHVAQSSCTSSASQSITVPSTTAGTVQVIALGACSSAGSSTISSASGGGGSWVTCPSHGCAISGVGDLGTTDLIYNITGTGGATSISVTISTSENAILNYAEFKLTCTGCAAISNQQNSRTTSSSSCSTCTAASFTSLTANDLLVQAMNIDNYPTTPSGSYVVEPTYFTFLYNLNSSTLTAPTVCQSSSSSTCTADAGAWQATALAFSQ